MFNNYVWMYAIFSDVFWVANSLDVVYFFYRANISHLQQQESVASFVTQRAKSGRAQALITVALALIIAGVTALRVETAGVDTASAASGANAALIAALVDGTGGGCVWSSIDGVGGVGRGMVGWCGV